MDFKTKLTKWRDEHEHLEGLDFQEALNEFIRRGNQAWTERELHLCSQCKFDGKCKQADISCKFGSNNNIYECSGFIAKDRK